MKPYKTKISPDFAVALKDTIYGYLLCPSQTHQGRVLTSILAEIYKKLKTVDEKVKPKYALKLTPAQALALRVLHMQQHLNPACGFGKRLRKIARQIHKQYS